MHTLILSPSAFICGAEACDELLIPNLNGWGYISPHEEESEKKRE